VPLCGIDPNVKSVKEIRFGFFISGFKLYKIFQMRFYNKIGRLYAADFKMFIQFCRKNEYYKIANFII